MFDEYSCFLFDRVVTLPEGEIFTLDLPEDYVLSCDSYRLGDEFIVRVTLPDADEMSKVHPEFYAPVEKTYNVAGMDKAASLLDDAVTSRLPYFTTRVMSGATPTSSDPHARLEVVVSLTGDEIVEDFLCDVIDPLVDIAHHSFSPQSERWVWRG